MIEFVGNKRRYYMNLQYDRERIIMLLQQNGLLCSSEKDVCRLSEAGHGCNCGKIMREIREGK